MQIDRIFNLVFHHPTPGRGGEILTLGMNKTTKTPLTAVVFVSMCYIWHMGKLKGAIAAGIFLRLSRIKILFFQEKKINSVGSNK
jgi:hypothetical protein